MSNIKELISGLDLDDEPGDGIEVYADSVKQALELASREFRVEVSMLDYEILEKGTKGLIGIGRKPYRLIVRKSVSEDKYKDILDIEKKLSKVAFSENIDLKRKAEHVDGQIKIRVTKSGIWLTVIPPVGRGKYATIEEVNAHLYASRINNADQKKIEKAVKKPSEKPVRIGDWIPNPDLDGSMRIELSDDDMKAYVYFIPPRYSGRHMEIDDILDQLKSAGVMTGIDEAKIKQYLDDVDYNMPLIAAEGTPAKNGDDAYIDYKVRINKTRAVFEEDEKGQVDFKDLDLLENVVVGQLLAVKVPAQEGIPGRTVTNRILPAKSGKDVDLKYGKGTILSEDGLELTAEINGQVVFNYSKITVDPVHYVKGDVSLQTGNIVFLGSVVVTGNVQDNFVVKAAGNIEVKGSVQKAFLEAEGNIIVRQGIVGRDEARIESTSGTIYAKFIQSANVYAEKDVLVPEGILHSNVNAGSRILSMGRRAKIVGGVLRAGEEVNARYIGSDNFTKTEICVGVNPKMLQQISDLKTNVQDINTELDKLKLDLKTLSVQKKNAGTLPQDKEELYSKLLAQKQKHTGRLNEIKLELDELNAYLGMLQLKGRICAEKSIYPGVEISIKDQKFSVKDQYSNIKFTLEKEGIRLSEYEAPDFTAEQSKMITMTRHRR